MPRERTRHLDTSSPRNLDTSPSDSIRPLVAGNNPPARMSHRPGGLPMKHAPPPTSQPGLFDPPQRRARSRLSGCRQTSREAQRSVKPDVQRYRDSVLSFIRGMGTHGATDDEMQDLLPMNPSTQRPRRGELAQDGLIVRTGEKRKTRTGRRADVWIATEHATPEQIAAAKAAFTTESTE